MRLRKRRSLPSLREVDPRVRFAPNYIRVTLAVPVGDEATDEVAAWDWNTLLDVVEPVVCEDVARLAPGQTLTDWHGNNVVAI